MTFESVSDARVEALQPNARLDRVASLVAQHVHDGAVLDIGCWSGGLARALVGRTTCSYTGIDIEPAAAAVEVARIAVPNQRFLVVASVESLPFAAESFDVIVLTEVIEHVVSGREVPLLRELARVLRPDGCIIVSTPYHNVLNALDPAWFFGHRHYSVSNMADLARQSGLSMIDVQFSGGIWTSLDINLLYFYKHVLYRPYVSYPWLYERVKREYEVSTRGATGTTLWCRLVH